MGVLRKALVVMSAATAVAMGPWAVLGFAGEDEGGPENSEAVSEIAPEADLAHHGHVSLRGDELRVRLESENHGPSAVPDATVRLDFSVRLIAGQALPPTCLWGGDRSVLCRTGPLRAVATARCSGSSPASTASASCGGKGCAPGS